MITAIQVKTDTPEVADPKDVRAGIFAAIIAILILFIILFLYTFEMLDPPPADVVVKTETTLEEIELKELVIEPGGGGATSPTDASPSPTDAKQVLTGNSSTSTTQTGKPNGKGTGDNPFGNGGTGGSETGGFEKDLGIKTGKTVDCNTKPKPTNYNSIKQKITELLRSTKSGKASIIITYDKTGKFRRIESVTGLYASEADILEKIKTEVKKSYTEPCENDQLRSYQYIIILQR
jgi:hypothetical protein